MMRLLKAWAVVLWLLVWMVPLALAYLLKKRRWRAVIVRWANRGLLWLLGVRLRVVGALAAERPLLVASNHLSYIDIPVLASVMDCRFVPKKEVARWPLIRHICTMLEVVYIDRHPGKIHQGQHAIGEALARGEVVAFFPEATTGDGKRLLPFKPAFFEVARGLCVQPVAIRYTTVSGLPMDYGLWPKIAWYGDMSLAAHAWEFLGLGRLEVEVHFLPPISMGASDRKSLARLAHGAIEQALLSH